MGLKKPDDKGGKKSEGLAILLRPGSREPSTGPTLSELSGCFTLKGEELEKALQYVLGVEDASGGPALTGASGISFAGVQEVVKKQLAFFEPELEPSTSGALPDDGVSSGRLGPRIMYVDRASVYGRLGLSADGLRLESQGNFSTCRANACVFAGKWMYEATLGTSGIQQIGWATLSCEFTNEEGVGDAEDSYAFDGKRVRKWCVYPEPYGQPWAPGDVIGCCLDLDKGELSFYRNGVSMGVAYPSVRTLKTGLGYFPAISLSHGERCHLNFGSQPFRCPIDGFKPLQAQPDVLEVAKCKYLWGCMSRLVEVTGGEGLSPSRMVSPSNVMMMSKPRLSMDDRVMLAAVVAEHLRPMLKSPYHIVGSFIPFLREIAGRTENMSTENLHLGLSLLECSLGKSEFQRIMVMVIETLSQLCGSSTFEPKDLPDTASYPHLKLMNALLKSTSVRRLFFRLRNLNNLLEGFLTRKQPTQLDLKDLLPNIWYKGCRDENSSEERMNNVLTALWTALQKVEQCQFELLQFMFEEDKATRSNFVLNFFKHLLKSNQGANRNVQPPGLSDVSVLVSSFNLLLRLLRPSLMRSANGPTCLEAFPARELFVDGALSDERCLHHDLPRLGGLLSHLQKEHPLLLSAGIPVQVHLKDEIGVVEGGPSISDEQLVPQNMVAKLLHILVLLYRLGIEVAMKMTLHQFQSESVQRLQLSRMEQRLASFKAGSSGSSKKKLEEDVQKQREDVIKCVRHCAWYKVVLFMPWKQECMFLITVYLAKMLTALSETSPDVFRYVPEAYVDAMLDLFQAVAKLEPRFADLPHLELLGLDHLISFLVRHFDHQLLVNPHLCDNILQGMAVLFADQEFLKACENCADAQKSLVPDLLRAFDTRYWLSISNIFLSVAKGTGFGQSRGSSGGGSSVYRQLLVLTCQEQPHLLDGFLNRLFNTLNWTVTELTVTLGEVEEHLERLAVMGNNQGNPDVIRVYRKASVLFNLSINLLRLLELIAWQMPHVFLTGSRLNLARVVEVIGFVLSHLTVGSDARVFEKVLTAPQSWPEWKSKVSRPTILAPVAGILRSLHKASKMKNVTTNSGSGNRGANTSGTSGSSERKGRESGVLWGPLGVVNNAVSGAVQRALRGKQKAAVPRDEGEVKHTIAGALAESLSAPQECLEYLNTIKWRSSFPHESMPKSLMELDEVIKAFKSEVELRKRTQSMDLEEGESVPEEFLDPIVMTMMEDPVILPDSKITVDRSTIERHLLTQQTDPFSRAELRKEMVEPNLELRHRIQEWRQSRMVNHNH